MALRTAEDLIEPFHWPDGGVSRVPFRLISDPEIYALEQKRIFKGPVWNYLCLEIEIPEPGDFKTTTVGELPVIAVRAKNGDIHCLVNRCAHKGALVCLKERGNAKALTCVYHAWTYGLDGRLKGVAFRNGIQGKGGMPKDFDPADHRLVPLKVTTFCSLVFATFSEETPPIEDFFGSQM